MSVDELWPLVTAGKAITTLPGHLYDLVRGMSGVRTILLEDGDPSVVVLARRQDDPNPLVEALFEVAREVAAQPPESSNGPKSG